MLALCNMDSDLIDHSRKPRSSLLFSPDEGATWFVVHRFAKDWSDVPEGFVVINENPLRLITFFAQYPLILEQTAAVESGDP